MVVANAAQPPTFAPKRLVIQSKKQSIPSQTVTRPHFVAGRRMHIKRARIALESGSLIAIRHCTR